MCMRSAFSQLSCSNHDQCEGECKTLVQVITERCTKHTPNQHLVFTATNIPCVVRLSL